jgi:hypothetical protein
VITRAVAGLLVAAAIAAGPVIGAFGVACGPATA